MKTQAQFRPFRARQGSALSACILLIGAGLIAGCAGRTPAARVAHPDAKVVGEAPARDVSVVGREDFGAAVTTYRSAAATGEGLSARQCSALADAFSAVYKRHRDIPEAKFNEGVIWEVCGDTGKAEGIYQTLLKDHGEYGPALNNLGRMQFLRGERRAAEELFRRASAAKNSQGYTNVAMLQRDQALTEETEVLREAVRNVQRSLAVDSSNIEAYALLATILYDHAKTKSQLEMARLVCLQATKVSEDYAPIYNLLGLILLKMERVTPALVQFRQAVAIEPDYKEALMNIGAVTLSFRDYATAETSFRRVLAGNPDREMQMAATVGLGVAYRGQRRYAEAMQQYQAARQLTPSDVDVLYNMGLLVQDYLFDANDPKAAIGQLEQARGFFAQFVSGARDRGKAEDARRRMRNIEEMIPLLREQHEMMQQLEAQGDAEG